MQSLTEIALEKAAHGIFTRPEVACWLGGTPHRQFSHIKRALSSGEVLGVHRGLYCLAPKYLPQKLNPLVLAQRIYGPSYISLESALSFHGWIPEAVYTITSVCVDRSREVDTPLGHFSFTRIPQNLFFTDVFRAPKENQGNGGPRAQVDETYFLASPLKALADYVYVHKENWTSAKPVIESLRVDESLLAGIDAESFDSLEANYGSLRVRRFLEGLRKDLKP